MRSLAAVLMSMIFVPMVFAQQPPAGFPNGCVDCHVLRPEADFRLSTMSKRKTAHPRMSVARGSEQPPAASSPSER